MSKWNELVLRYADGRRVCNCGGAYYDDEGRCAAGCQSNQMAAQNDIAARVLAELDRSGSGEPAWALGH